MSKEVRLEGSDWRKGREMKKCAVCHSLAFDDMDTCYECMSPLGGAGESRADSNGVPQAMLGEHVALKDVAGVSRYGEVSEYTIEPGVDDDLDVDSLLDMLFGPGSASSGEHGGEPSIGWVVRVAPGGGRAWSKRFPAQTQRVSIGRASDNDIKVRDLHVSRHHAELVFAESGIWLKDLDSRNMTFAGGVPVLGSRRIAEGTPIRIGNAELTVGGDSHDVSTELRGLRENA